MDKGFPMMSVYPATRDLHYLSCRTGKKKSEMTNHTKTEKKANFRNKLEKSRKGQIFHNNLASYLPEGYIGKESH